MKNPTPLAQFTSVKITIAYIHFTYIASIVSLQLYIPGFHCLMFYRFRWTTMCFGRMKRIVGLCLFYMHEPYNLRVEFRCFGIENFHSSKMNISRQRRKENKLLEGHSFRLKCALNKNYQLFRFPMNTLWILVVHTCLIGMAIQDNFIL